MKKLLAIFAYITLQISPLGDAQAQTPKLDSLSKALIEGKLMGDSARLNLRIKIAEEYMKIKPDTAKKIFEAIIKEVPPKWPSLKLLAQIGSGMAYFKSSSLDTAMLELEKALKTASQTGNPLDSGKVLQAIGFVYYDKGDYQQANWRLFAALRIYEKIGDQQLIARANNDIGLLYSDQGMHEEAEKYHRKNLILGQKSFMELVLLGAYNNLGLVKLNTMQLDSAVYYFKKALETNDRYFNNKMNSSLFLANISETLIKQNKLVEAFEVAAKCLAEAESLGYQRMIANANNLMGMIRYEEGNYTLAVAFLEKGTGISAAIGSSKDSFNALEYLHKAYAKSGRNDMAYKTYNGYIQLRDSLNKVDNLKDLLKKDNEIKNEKMKLEQEKQRIENEAELDRQKLMRNGTAVGLGLTLLLVFFVFRSYRIKQKANTLLSLRNEEISAQKEEILQNLEMVAQQKEVIAQANEELVQQQEELIVLNENLDKQKGQLENTYANLKHTSEQLQKSIRYASHIQDVVLPEISEMKSFFGDAFIFYLPKDVVSGDFYWFSRIDPAKAVFALADCTGHGVPGAFMSMLGATLLHETVNVKGVNDDPGRILRNLHSGLRKILRQEQGKNDDGMDISIGIFQKNGSDEGISVVYAGAKASICVVTDGVITEIKGDNQYVGGKPLKRPFENKNLLLTKGSAIYFYTDGFADQNNEERQKFGSSSFKETLTNLAGLPLESQKHQLAEVFESHKKGEAQRDDISVVGFFCG